MKFSLMFWGDSESCRNPQAYYRSILDLSVYADANGYCGVWLPERHFHPWGGMHPNPSVLAAAVAAVTTSLKIRAGSLVLPLHNVFRAAEDWAVVDNLSGGRVELSIATGWHRNDFLLAPDRYETRKSDVWQSVATLRELWRGRPGKGVNGKGEPIEVTTFPKPVQSELPIWITTTGSTQTIRAAGAAGFNLLTHMLNQTDSGLQRMIGDYRGEARSTGIAGGSEVALMLHTYIGDEVAAVRTLVQPSMVSYLTNSADLALSDQERETWSLLSKADQEVMMEVAFERYFETASLFGTRESCKPVVERLAGFGVTEICCLVDFGLPMDVVLRGLEGLTELKNSLAGA